MQHLALISTIVLAAGLVLTAAMLPGGLRATFSQRVANNKTAEVLYALLFLIALPALYIFIVDWFVPTLNLSSVFIVFAAIAVIFQIACTFVPERGGKMTTVHRVLTGISGLALLPMVALIALSDSIGMPLILTSWVALVCMLVLLTIALMHQNGFKYALMLQVGYYASFFAVLLMTTYLS